MYYLSIITVCMNDVDGLIRTRDSVLPLPENCEWIIIDAQSTDDTMKILKSLPKNKNIIWISEPDKGIFDGMNKGITVARGKFLNFLNSGDFYDRNTFIEITTNELFSGDIMVYNYNPVCSKLKSSYSRKFESNIEKLKCYDCIPHQSTLISSDVFRKIGNYNLKYKYSSDYDFFSRAYNEGIKFHFYEQTFLSFFVQDGATSKLKLSLIQGKENKQIQEKNFHNYSISLYIIFLLKYSLSFIPYGNSIYLYMRKLTLVQKRQ